MLKTAHASHMRNVPRSSDKIERDLSHRTVRITPYHQTAHSSRMRNVKIERDLSHRTVRLTGQCLAKEACRSFSLFCLRSKNKLLPQDSAYHSYHWTMFSEGSVREFFIILSSIKEEAASTRITFRVICVINHFSRWQPAALWKLYPGALSF